MVMDDNEIYNDLEIMVLIQDWLEEETDEYWEKMEAA